MEAQSHTTHLQKNICYFATFQEKGTTGKFLCLFKANDKGNISIENINSQKKAEFNEEVNIKKNPYILVPIESINGDIIVVYIKATFVSPYATV